MCSTTYCTLCTLYNVHYVHCTMYIAFLLFKNTYRASLFMGFGEITDDLINNNLTFFFVINNVNK